MTGIDYQRLAMHFNPRPPRRGRQFNDMVKKWIFHISTHAPRAGGDG